MSGFFVRAHRDNAPSALQDVVAIGIAICALAAFMLVARDQFDGVRDQMVRLGADNSSIIIGLLLLNVALTIYGWRRYRDAARELIERRIAEERANNLASTDPLTGFLNRRLLSETTAELMADASRSEQSVAMLVIDIDGFKAVNDLHGHLTGDILLRAAAQVISQALPRGSVTARLGADEFAAAFAFDPHRPAEVDRISASISDRLGRPFELAGVHVHVTASIGAARSDAECATVEALTRRADIAMVSAKKLGRGQCIWFNGSMERELQARNETEAGLRKGIPSGECVPFFEQQVDLVTGGLHGFEMLARWNHPERGLVSPDEFIGVAEECGLIGDLSLSVMRQALEEARHWDPSLKLSVNISPLQLKDPWLSQKIVQLLVETGFPAERLEVEITESSLFENLGLAQAITTSLKNQGVCLALDDFGTGYSSLAHLRALPFDRLKIDRSFVSSINDNAESAAIVNAIARLAESLGLALTAEGIENDDIEARLRSIGTFKGQGYLFGRPVAAAQVRSMLSARGLIPGERRRVAAPAAEYLPRPRRAGRAA